MLLTSFSRPARHLLRQVCLPPCRRSQGATAAIVPRASRDQHTKSENGAKAAGGRKKRSSNAQLLLQIANVIDGICRSDSADRRHDTEATRSPLQSSDRSFAGMSASLTRMSADLAAMRADTADIQSVLDARTEELMRSSLASEFGSRTVQPFIVSSLHSCLDYFGEQLGKVGIPRHEAIASIVSAVQADKSLPAEMVTNVVSRMRRHLISINNDPSVPKDGMRMAQTALVAAKAALETAQDPTATTEDLCQAMHRSKAAAETALQRCESMELPDGVIDEWNAFGDADMTVEYLASLHNAKHLRKLLVDGNTARTSPFVLLLTRGCASIVILDGRGSTHVAGPLVLHEVLHFVTGSYSKGKDRGIAELELRGNALMQCWAWMTAGVNNGISGTAPRQQAVRAVMLCRAAAGLPRSLPGRVQSACGRISTETKFV